MRRTATIVAGTGIAIAVFGGGLALAFDGDGSSPAGVTRAATSTLPSPVPPSGTPTETPTGPVAPPPPSSATTHVGRAEAGRIALRAVPGGRIESVEFEREHGRPVWDIDVMSGYLEYRVQVDTRTGEITRKRAGHHG
jgi:hypothetical protein